MTQVLTVSFIVVFMLNITLLTNFDFLMSIEVFGHAFTFVCDHTWYITMYFKYIIYTVFTLSKLK